MRWRLSSTSTGPSSASRCSSLSGSCRRGKDRDAIPRRQRASRIARTARLPPGNTEKSGRHHARGHPADGRRGHRGGDGDRPGPRPGAGCDPPVGGDPPESGVVVARVAGITLVALSVAASLPGERRQIPRARGDADLQCPHPDPSRFPRHRGQVCGRLLWPAVVVHAALAVLFVRASRPGLRHPRSSLSRAALPLPRGSASTARSPPASPRSRRRRSRSARHRPASRHAPAQRQTRR